MLARRAIERFNRSDKTSADKAKLAADSFMLLFAATGSIILINSMRNVFFEREEKVGLFESMVLQWLEVTLGNIYAIGPLVSGFSGSIRSGNLQGFAVNDPITSVANDAVKAAITLYSGLKSLITNDRYKSGRKRGEEKWKSQIPRATLKTLDTMGAVKGLPIKTVRKLIGATGKQTGKLIGLGESKSRGRSKSRSLKGKGRTLKGRKGRKL